MSKIGKQQLSPELLDELGGSTVFYGKDEPLDAKVGSMWMQTGMGSYEIDGADSTITINVLRAVASDDEPVDDEALWFDTEPEPEPV